MQRSAQTIGLVLLIATLSAGGFFLGRNSADKSETTVPHRMAANVNERKVLYWQAPMNPMEVYDSPGKSAMGMDLVPLYEDAVDAVSGGVVSIDPTTIQNMGVRTTHVTRMDLSRVVRTVGTVEYNEEARHVVSSKISGWIEKLHASFVGQSVRQGDLLLELYSPAFVTTQEEYLLARRSVSQAAQSSFASARKDAELLLESARKRLEYWDILPAEIERLAQTGEVRRTVLFTSPVNGIVTEKHVTEGAYLTAGTDLFLIADLSTVWVHASLHESDLPWIAVGQAAAVEMAYLPGKTYTGRVSYIYPFLREKARDILVRLVFNNSGQNLKPGMYVNVKLQGRVYADATVIPTESVIHSGERHTAFVVRAAGQFEPREIRIGEEGGPGGQYTRVISGLTEGEEVVISAQFMLDSESRMQEAIRKMLPERKQPGGPPAEHQNL